MANFLLRRVVRYALAGHKQFIDDGNDCSLPPRRPYDLFKEVCLLAQGPNLRTNALQIPSMGGLSKLEKVLEAQAKATRLFNWEAPTASKSLQSTYASLVNLLRQMNGMCALVNCMIAGFSLAWLSKV